MDEDNANRRIAPVESECMAKQAIAKSESAHDLLDEACARNLSVEIHGRQLGEPFVARARLLALDGDCICMDQPQCIDAPVELHTGQRVTIHFLHAGTRYAFRTRVAKAHRLVSLNVRQRIIGLALRMPEDVREQQRRDDFRVSLAGNEVQALVHAIDPSDIILCPIDAERFGGRITDLSAGGMGLVVERTDRRTFETREKFCIQFCLPGIDMPFVLPVEVRHFRLVCENSALRVGLRFLPCDYLDTKAQVQEINKFVAAEQRRKLRRGR